MKSKLLLLLWATSFFSACSASTPESEDDRNQETTSFKEIKIGDFETGNSSPYVFRFGNKGTAKDFIDYKPRWVYSHTVVSNPAVENENLSSQVLKYTSMEARNYGIKILFANPVPLSDLGKIQFKIYQPDNVIGKPVWKDGIVAKKQELCVKLLSKFNTVNDFRQDDGIIMVAQSISFTEEKKWITYTCDFNKSDYVGQTSKFSKGVMGIAILPTYHSEATLAEENPYVCYIDDIVLNPLP